MSADYGGIIVIRRESTRRDSTVNRAQNEAGRQFQPVFRSMPTSSDRIGSDRTASWSIEYSGMAASHSGRIAYESRFWGISNSAMCCYSQCKWSDERFSWDTLMHWQNDWSAVYICIVAWRIPQSSVSNFSTSLLSFSSFFTNMIIFVCRTHIRLY